MNRDDGRLSDGVVLQDRLKPQLNSPPIWEGRGGRGGKGGEGEEGRGGEEGCRRESGRRPPQRWRGAPGSPETTAQLTSRLGWRVREGREVREGEREKGRPSHEPISPQYVESLSNLNNNHDWRDNLMISRIILIKFRSDDHTRGPLH